MICGVESAGSASTMLPSTMRPMIANRRLRRSSTCFAEGRRAATMAIKASVPAQIELSAIVPTISQWRATCGWMYIGQKRTGFNCTMKVASQVQIYSNIRPFCDGAGKRLVLSSKLFIAKVESESSPRREDLASGTIRGRRDDRSER